MYSCYGENIINMKKAKNKPIKNKKRNKTNQLNSLQVQGYLLNIIRNNNSFLFSADKSTSLSAPLMAKAGMTIEAAIVLPLFLIGMLSFIYFILIMNFQNLLCQNMTNTARDISKYSFAVKKIGKVIEGNFVSTEISKDVTQRLEDLSVTKGILQGGLTGIYALNEILDDDVKRLAKNLGMYDGIMGVNMMESNLSEQEDVDLVFAYTVKIPMVSSSFYKMAFINRCYFRNFIGKSINQKSRNSYDKVYITENGKVYHIYNDCTHIELSIFSVPFSSLPSLRNKGGGKYKKCEKCVISKIDNKDYVIVTIDGDRYHCRRECSGITRNVLTVDISQVGDRTLCKRCREREAQ